MVNEGLEALGTDEYEDDGDVIGAGTFESSGLKRIKLSSTIKRIEYCAFENCKNLRDIKLPDGLTYIGKRCFYGSGLESVTIPPSVRAIGPYAFCECR